MSNDRVNCSISIDLNDKNFLLFSKNLEPLMNKILKKYIDDEAGCDDEDNEEDENLDNEYDQDDSFINDGVEEEEYNDNDTETTEEIITDDEDNRKTKYIKIIIDDEEEEKPKETNLNVTIIDTVKQNKNKKRKY